MLEAQRIDMMTMLQIKMQLDAHMESAVLRKEGFLEKQVGVQYEYSMSTVCVQYEHSRSTVCVQYECSRSTVGVQ
jgi:hypothetical protein